MDISKMSKVVKFDQLQDPDETWILGEKIGRGTYGEVYEAIHKVTAKKAAVKILENISDFVEEIEEEFRVLNELRSVKNLPRFYGIYLKRNKSDGVRSKDQVWFVMEVR